MTSKPRNIDDVINNIMVLTRQYGKNTTNVIGELRYLQSSIRYMAPERLMENHHWHALCDLLAELFPKLDENKNDPFMEALHNLMMSQTNEKHEKYQGTDEEEKEIHTYIEYRNFIV